MYTVKKFCNYDAHDMGYCKGVSTNMKRIDKSPTDENLLESMTGGALGRNEDIVSFIGMLDEMEGGYSLCVDGPWGSGKTFFVKQVEMLLRHENDKLEGSHEELAALVGDEKPLGPRVKKSYFPVYFNAWDVDTFPDPLIALVGTMRAEHPLALANGADKSTAKDLLGRASDVVGLISPVVGLVNPVAGVVAKVAAGVAGGAIKAAEPSGVEGLVESFSQYRGLEKAMNEYVDALLKDTGDRLVLFVDELDRCEPRFALRLLDEMKFVSRNNRVIVVYSTCLAQLEKAVGNFYGMGFDAHRYLSRFFDLPPLRLKRVDGSKYLRESGSSSADDAMVSDQISEIIDVKSLSMRDVNRVISEIDNRRVLVRRPSSPLVNFIEDQLFPVAVAFQLTEEDPRWHEMAVKGDFGPLWKYTEGLPLFSGSCAAIAGYALPASPSPSPADMEGYLNLLCVCLFGSDQEANESKPKLQNYRMEYNFIHPLNRDLFRRFH